MSIQPNETRCVGVVGENYDSLARELSALLDVQVDAHPYDVGYWSRVAGWLRPGRRSYAQRGWDVANNELAA